MTLEQQELQRQRDQLAGEEGDPRTHELHSCACRSLFQDNRMQQQGHVWHQHINKSSTPRGMHTCTELVTAPGGACMLTICLLCPAEHLDEVAVQHAAALAPVIAGLQEEIAVLKRELEQQRLQAAVTEQELEGLTSRINEVRRM